MTSEELNIKFALVADHLESVARSLDGHDAFLNHLEEGIDELRNENRRVSNNLEELRGIVRTAVRAGIRERRQRHQVEEEFRKQMREDESSFRKQMLEIETRHEQRFSRMEQNLAEIEARNQEHLGRIETAVVRMEMTVERLAELMAARNGHREKD